MLLEDPTIEEATKTDEVVTTTDEVVDDTVKTEEVKTEGTDAGASEVDFYTAVEGAVWNADDPLDEATLKAISIDEIKALPPNARMVLAGLIQRDKARIAEAEKVKADGLAAAEAERAEARKALAEVERKQLAHSKAVADPDVIDKLRADIAKKPAVVNPHDPKSLEAAIRAAAAEATMEAMGPAAARYDKLARAQAADAIFESAGMNRRDPVDNKAVNERLRSMFGRQGMSDEQFKAHLGALTASARSNGGKSPVEIAVEIEAAQRKAQADAARRSDESAARIAGARSMTTARPHVTPQKTDKQFVDEIMDRLGDDSEAYNHEWNNNQKFREAVLRVTA